MNITGTLINYYFHCKRQCYLHGINLNLEDNSENVKIGKSLHEEKEQQIKNKEIKIDNIKIDGLTDKYVIEIKKSDADITACTYQLLLYLKILKGKGIERTGKLEFVEKNKQNRKTVIVELTPEKERELDECINNIQLLISSDIVPDVINKPGCKLCAYYEYCYI
jgi:CRISPR-associated exonuclease Cas4